MGYGTQKRGITVHSREDLSLKRPSTSDITDTWVQTFEVNNGLKMLGLVLSIFHKQLINKCISVNTA